MVQLAVGYPWAVCCDARLNVCRAGGDVRVCEGPVGHPGRGLVRSARVTPAAWHRNAMQHSVEASATACLPSPALAVMLSRKRGTETR